jgi:hypothetical protein
MNPIQICNEVLGDTKLTTLIEELSSPQIKAVLKEGKIKVKLPGGFVSQKKKRSTWTKRILSAVDTENVDAASELLQQWLLHRRRGLLIRYLDLLEVKHRDGETDDSFLISKPSEALRSCAEKLYGEFDRVEVAAYLAYIAHQQRSNVFDDFPLLGGDAETNDGGASPNASETPAPPTDDAPTDNN